MKTQDRRQMTLGRKPKEHTPRTFAFATESEKLEFRKRFEIRKMQEGKKGFKKEGYKIH
jgi:hypothetical protein